MPGPIDRSAVDIDLVVEMTMAMVAVDTRNPPGNEREISGVCHDLLAPFDAGFVEVEPAPWPPFSGGDCPPSRRGRHERPTLIVNGHLDVVPVKADAWETDPFGPFVDGDKLFGRGTADMKGGIAAALGALHLLRQVGVEPACNIVFHLVADEERGGQLGTKALLDQGLITGDACLVPEPTSLAICLAERGLLHTAVTVHGRPGHGSRPREGVSAVEHAARVALALHAADFGDTEHPLLGTPTANVGTISGGSGINTVAESCTLGVDRRLLPGAKLDESLAGLRSHIDPAVGGLRYDIEVLQFGEASEQDRSHPFVSQVASAVAGATGSEPPLIGMTFTTDARFVRNQAGIPTVVCGPGDVEQAHVNDEWVSVERLAQATLAYARLMAEFSSAGFAPTTRYSVASA